LAATTVGIASVDTAAGDGFPVAPLLGALFAAVAPAGASPIALGGVAAGGSRRLIAAANPHTRSLPVNPATGAAAPSLGSDVGAVVCTAEAAIMGDNRSGKGGACCARTFDPPKQPPRQSHRFI
jgi:hypothetical protein